MMEPRVFSARVVDAATAKTLVPVVLVPAKDKIQDLMWRVAWACREFATSRQVNKAPRTLRLFVQPTWSVDGGGSKTKESFVSELPVRELILNECLGTTNFDLLDQRHINTNCQTNREHVDLFVSFDQDVGLEHTSYTSCLTCGKTMQENDAVFYWMYTCATAYASQKTVLCRQDFLRLEPRLQRLFVALPFS